MKKFISTALIFIGVILILYPVIGRWYNQYQQEKLMKEWVDEGEATDKSTETQDEATPEESESKSHYKPRVIGSISIKKISIDIPIVEGTTQQDLKFGAGHLKGTATLGAKGNTALAGHRSYTLGKMFNRLNEVTSGDEIIIKTKKDTYKYVVYEKKVVEPTDFSVLKSQGDESLLTLITCEPIYIATHRLIVHAKLVS
ncbi:MAG: sortase [Eubacteriales bacterium]